MSPSFGSFLAVDALLSSFAVFLDVAVALERLALFFGAVAWTGSVGALRFLSSTTIVRVMLRGERDGSPCQEGCGVSENDKAMCEVNVTEKMLQRNRNI